MHALKVILLALCIPLAAGCADMKENIREKECASDWTSRGMQAGQAGAALQGELTRHQQHCPNFDADAFKDGYQKGFARRARPVG